GGFTGYVAPDEKTVAYLMEYRGMTRDAAERLCQGLSSDAGAEYCQVIEIDAGAIRPLIALPGDPGNGRYIAETAERGRVDIAYAGSCTAGEKEDMDMYARGLEEAAGRGERRGPWVRFYVQWGGRDVKRYCEARDGPRGRVGLPVGPFSGHRGSRRSLPPPARRSASVAASRAGTHSAGSTTPMT